MTMSGKVRVILLDDVPAVGKAGQVVEVSEGYARNWLFPRGAAALATAAATEAHVATERAKRAQAEAELRRLQTLADQLAGTELKIKARVKEGQEIFGSITAKQIADELNKHVPVVLRGKDIGLQEPITHLGSQDVVVHLSPEIEVTIHVTVTVAAGSADADRTSAGP